MPELVKAISELGWSLPTSIQAEAIPMVLGGGDLVAAAETGSGKTGAFAIPVLQIIHEIRARRRSDTDQSDQPCFSNADRDQDFVIAAGGWEGSAAGQKWSGCRAALGLHAGACYFEVKILQSSGTARLGWSTKSGNLDLGKDANGFGYGGTGKKAHKAKFENYGESFGVGDVVGAYLDFEQRLLGFTKNGVDLGTAFKIPPLLDLYDLYPTVALKDTRVFLNTGAQPFTWAEPRFSNLFSLPRESTSLHPVRTAVFEPSHELARQVETAVNSLKQYLPAPGLDLTVCLGGQGAAQADQQVKDLQAGVDIVVGTPARLVELFETGRLALTDIRLFILDECDALLRQEASKIYHLHRRLPSQTAQILLFSATLSELSVRKLASQITRFPAWLDLKSLSSPDTVHNRFINCDPCQDSAWLQPPLASPVDGIYAEKPALEQLTDLEQVSAATKLLRPQLLLRILQEVPMSKCLIFVRTKQECDQLELFLNTAFGFCALVLHSARSSKERAENLARFKHQSEAKYLLSTDIAARGIDIPHLPFVVNYRLPESAEEYVHRIGRVGRAEHVGLAISIVARRERVWFHRCKAEATCRNTADSSAGGCTVVLDDQETWRMIQGKLGETIAPLVFLDFKNPSQYGQLKPRAVAAPKNHAAELAETVELLAHLENQTQLSYWRLATWGRKG